MASMAAISLRQLQQISPSGGGRRVPPLPPQKIMEKIERPFFHEMKASIRKWRRGDHRGPDGPRWRGLHGGPHQLSSLSLVAPLVCYDLSRCFLCKNIDAIKIPDQIEVPKVPETSKYENRRFFVSRKLNTKGELCRKVSEII
jgi:hypothetical protein